MAPRSIASSASQQGPTEAEIFRICTRAGVSVVGIQRGFGIVQDFVLFQPIGTTLAVPLSLFTDPDRALAAIEAKLAQAGAK